MNQKDRHKKIIKELKKKSLIKTTELSSLFSVSRETLRKDIQILVERGLIRRSFGEISFIENSDGMQEIGVLGKSERQNKIIEYLKKKKSVRISTLSNFFGVSLPTIRSDLKDLERLNLISKKHGYINIISSRYINLFQSDLNFSLEVTSSGTRGLSLIDYGETVFLDNSRINEYIALHLSARDHIKVVTNSIYIMELLIRNQYPHEVLLLQGSLDMKLKAIKISQYSAYIEILKSLHINKLFFTIDKYEEDGYFSSSDEFNILNLNTLSNVNGMFICFVSNINSSLVKNENRFNVEKLSGKFQESIIFGESISTTLIEYSKVKFCHDGIVESYITNELMIGFSIPHLRTNYFHQIKTSLEKELESKQGISLLIQNESFTTSTYNKHIDYFISKSVNLIIEFFYDESNINLISEKCRAANVKVISIDSYCPGGIFIGINNYELGKCSGINTAYMIQKKWGGKVSNIVLFSQKKTGNSIINREQGFKDAIQKTTNQNSIEIVEIDVEFDSDSYLTDFYSYLKSERFIGNVVFVFLTEHSLMKMYDIIKTEFPSEKAMIIGSTSSNEMILGLSEKKDQYIAGYIEIDTQEYGRKISSIILDIQKGLKPADVYHVNHYWKGL